MIQIKLPVRAYKRLIYLAFASSFLCFLALHLAISYQRVHVPLETLVALDGSGGGHTTATASGGYMSFRGLLQKSPLEQQQSLLPSAASPQLLTSTSAAAAASINGSADNKTRTAAAASAAATAVQSTNSVVQQASAAVQSSAVPPASPSAAVVPPTSALISNLSKEGGAVPVAVPTVVQSEQQQHQPSSEDISQYFDIAPHVDHSPSLSEVQQLNELEQQEPHLALNYWQKAKKYPKAKAGATNKSCRVDFPSLYELEFNNIYWQKFNTANSSFYLYGAYYDDRWRGGPLPMVRILAMIDRVSPPPALCQIWFDRISVPIISQATYIYGWYNKWGNYHDGFLQPYIVTCKIPRIKGLPKDFYPTSVSLVENRCHKATNNLRILNDRPPVKQQFAVCVKGLDFLHEDLSVRLVEWIELLRLLGANKIFLYELEIHPNISKVLQHYQQDGIVELTKITLPGNQPNLPGFRHLYLKNKLTNKRQNELIPYNDCLYRNLYRFEYIALLDIDEIIMPLGGQANWSELMAEVQRLSLLEKNYTRASYNVRNVYFLDDLGLGEEQLAHMAHEAGIPRYLHMLQHVYRSQNYTKPGQYVKCFHNTERAVSLHNHFPLNCFGTCTTYSIPVELAHLQHYRKDCVGPLKKSCKEFRTYTTRDTTIFKYKDPLISSTTAVLKKLGFFDGLAAAESAASAHQQL